jgi:hypothetical protein
MRSWGEAERPVRENLEPAGAFGLKVVSSACQLAYRSVAVLVQLALTHL